jgi:putative tricarboxylic transport membrane protein
VAVSPLTERLAVVVTLAVTGVAWWMSARFPVDARFFPRMVLGLLGVLSVVWLARTFVTGGSRFAAPVAEGETGEVEPFFIHAGYFVAAITMLTAYVLLVGQIGYFSSTILFIPAMALALGYRRPLGILLTTGAFVGMIYLIFVVMFRRRLPTEFFATWF